MFMYYFLSLYMYLSLIDVMYVSCLYFVYFICLCSPFLEENKISIYLSNCFYIGKCLSILLPHWQVYEGTVKALASICLY